MVISAVLLIVYAGALFQGLSHRTEEEARNTIHNYLTDFEKNQQTKNDNSFINAKKECPKITIQSRNGAETVRKRG